MEFESRLANPGTYMPIFRWRLYGDPEVAPLGRSWRGAITAILRWRLSADLQMAPLRRSVTVAEQEDVCPLSVVPADCGSEHLAVEILGSDETANRKGEMEDGLGHRGSDYRGLTPE